MTVIPFYGSKRPDMFAIEREAMDRPGHVLKVLDELLPQCGRILDMGAGNGYVADALTTPDRYVLPMEPDQGMIDASKLLPWIQGDVEMMPFRSDSFQGAYATWAYFFPEFLDITAGYREVSRVVCQDSPIVIVNNIGDDEFTALAPGNISENPVFFRSLGFEMHVVETVFQFNSLEDARLLLDFYFGDKGRDGARQTLSYRVGIFVKQADSH